MFLPFHDDNPTRRTAYVTFVLIAINVVSFVVISRLPPLEQQSVLLHRGFVPARIAQLKHPRPLEIRRPVVDRHARFGRRVLQQVITLKPDRREILLSLLSCMFMHAGWMHLIGNMWFLWLFGNNVEDRLGHVLFLLFYLLGGLLATGCHWLTNPNSVAPVVGASGAVAAVLGAYAITWPWARVHTLVFLVIFFTIVEVPALLLLGFWFAMQLISGHEALRGGMQVANVAWWAHIGGFLAGLFIMPMLCDLLGTDQPEDREAQPTGEPD